MEYVDPVSGEQALSPWLSALAASQDLANDPVAIAVLQREKLRHDASPTHRLIACTGLLRLNAPDALVGVDQIALSDIDDGRRMGLPKASDAERAVHGELVSALREVPPEIRRTQVIGMLLIADRSPAWLTIAVADQADLHHDQQIGSWLRNTIDKHPRGVRRDLDHTLGAGRVQMTTASLLIGCHRPSVETDVRRLNDTLVTATEQCFELWPDRPREAPPLPIPAEQLRASRAAMRFADAVLQRKAHDSTTEPWFDAQHVHDQRAAFLDRLVTISCSPDDSRQARVLALLADCASD
jgi:hypothetical protein